MKRVLKFSLFVVVIAALGFKVYNLNSKSSLSDLALANIEALAHGEVITGRVCFYKGNELFEKRIPCTADFPNIGSCGEPVFAFFSDNRAQCIK